VDVAIAAFMPARTDFGVRIDFAPRLLGLLSSLQANGEANAWITLEAEQPPLLPLAHRPRHRRGRHAPRAQCVSRTTAGTR
jgi:hypothetical protein